MPSQKNPKRNRRALPQVISPATTRCIPVNVPDDPEWLALFVGAIDELGKRSTWDYDPATVDDLRAVSDLWRVITDDVQETVLNGPDCEAVAPTDPQDCTIINPVHPSIGYFPNHPVLTPGSGFPWPAPAWCTDCAILGLGLETDVLIRIDSAPFFTDLSDLLASGVPSFTLHFSGEGEIDLRFAAVPVGGTAWVFPDGNPLVGKAVDLEWIDLDDFAGSALIEILIGLLAGDLVNTTTVTHEMVFDTPGSHTITAWFFPKVEVVEWPPIGWGGGLRSIQLCGDSITLEEAPMDWTLDCSSSTLELKLDGDVVSTIDLDACHPHPAPPAIPDYTLNRNNGDLQLLKDAVLHDSVQFPVYEVAYLESTHLLQLWRDSVLEDTAPLPSYTLTKPTDDEIRLHRNAITESIIEDKFLTYRLQENGDQHELTEDAAVVSSVTDDDTVPGDPPMTYFEAMWDLTLERHGDEQPDFMSDAFGEGTWVPEVGYVSGYDGPTTTQEMGLVGSFGDFTEISRIKLTYLVTAGAGGEFLHQAIHNIANLFIPFEDGAGDASGPGNQVFDMGVNWRWNTPRNVQFLYLDTDAGSEDIVTLTKVEVMGNGWPTFKFFGDATTITMFNELDEAFA